LESLEEKKTLPYLSVTQKKVQSKESALSCRFQEASVPTKPLKGKRKKNSRFLTSARQKESTLKGSLKRNCFLGTHQRPIRNNTQILVFNGAIKQSQKKYHNSFFLTFFDYLCE